MRITAWAIVCGLGVSAAVAQTGRHDVLDRILDTYVRNGRVYYRALQIERAALDRYVTSLDVAEAQVAGWSRAEQQAFWLNAYNALVLRTVIDAYPTRARSADYPAKSIRQIPGAFDGIRYRVGGRQLTLDGIETLMLDTFGDARMSLGIGRGAEGGGRLRSEAYRPDRVEEQLDDAVRECVRRVSCVKVDLAADELEVSPMIGWRSEAFVRSFGPAAAGRWASRSPVEQAVAAMVYPHLFRREQAMLDRDTFRMVYGEFDWSLNDLTGGRSRFPQILAKRGQRSSCIPDDL